MAYGLIPELISASIFRRLRSPGCSSGPYPIEGPPAAGENLKITPGNNSHTGTSVTQQVNTSVLWFSTCL